MFIQLSVHPVTQLVLTQSSDSFLFFAFFLFLDFFLCVIFILMRDSGLGRELNQDLGLRGFRLGSNRQNMICVQK